MTATWPTPSIGLPVRLATELSPVANAKHIEHHLGGRDDLERTPKSSTTVLSPATAVLKNATSPAIVAALNTGPELPYCINAKSASRKHKHSRSSYSDLQPLSDDHNTNHAQYLKCPSASPNQLQSYNHTSANLQNNSLMSHPFKRSMPSPDKTVAVINASGRQAASLIRVATAVGYRVRAQLRNLLGVVATELSANPHVTILVGELYTRHKATEIGNNGDSSAKGPCVDADQSELDLDDVTQQTAKVVGVNHELITELFRGAQLAFINTTFYGDEVSIGLAIIDAAATAGIEHLVYSSMPDHSAYNPAWPALPLWASKHVVEKHMRACGLPSTFVYTGIYYNNFTSLPFPLFCTEIQPDGGFVWQAPFHPHVKLPWLDAEHDVGPAILQIFKDGAVKWSGRRIALAYEMLTPLEACEVFSRGIGRPLRYTHGPIKITVPIPSGYRRQLEALEALFNLGRDNPADQPPYFGDPELERNCPAQAMALWEGPRLLEEYATEVFPLEERANGLTWMLGNSSDTAALLRHHVLAHGGSYAPPHDDCTSLEQDLGYEPNDEKVPMKSSRRDEETWLA